MKLNRCVKQDYGHVGCAADVIELMDVRCSGRSRCEIAIPDVTFAKTRPCPEDLKPYLEVGYNCVPVQTPSRRCHQRPGPLLVSSLNSGYLTNHVTEATGCGTGLTPWVIEVESGQTVRVELFDFNVLELARQLSFVEHQCPVYAVLREVLATGVRNLTICGGTSRERHVYTSVTNRLEIAFTVSADKPSSSFMLRYAAQGCTETVSVVNARILRDESHVIVKCNNSRQEYYLRCIGNRWVGEAANCSPDFYHLLSPERIDYTDVTINNGVYIVIVLVTSSVVGLLVLVTGLSIIKSRRRVWCMPLTSPDGSPISTTADKLYLTRTSRAYSATPVHLIDQTALIGEMGNHFVDTPHEMQLCITGNVALTTGEEVTGSRASKDLAGSRESGRRLGWWTRPRCETAADPNGVEDEESFVQMSQQESRRNQARKDRARPGIAVMTDRDSDSSVRRAAECKPLIVEAAEEGRPNEQQDQSQNFASSQKYILFTFSSQA